MDMRLILSKYRNTLFVNLSRFQEFKEKSRRANLKIIGSLWVEKNTVYYVDNEGKWTVHTMEGVRG